MSSLQPGWVLLAGLFLSDGHGKTLPPDDEVLQHFRRGAIHCAIEWYAILSRNELRSYMT
jgi:hypothetical protein